MRWERGNERTRHHDLRRTNYDSGTGHHHDDYDHDSGTGHYHDDYDCGIDHDHDCGAGDRDGRYTICDLFPGGERSLGGDGRHLRG